MPNLASLEAVDFRYVLLEYFKKLHLNENELVVILMIDHLAKQGNDFVTSDFISLKTNYSTGEIDKVMAGLVKKELLSFDLAGGKTRTSLEPLRKRLYKLLEIDMTKNRANLVSAERSEILSRLQSYYEKRLNRTLSPIEADSLSIWLDDSYSEDDIKAALEVALSERKHTIKSIDKALRLGRKKDDMDKEGYSAVSETWDKDIEETLRIAKVKWLDDDDR